MLDSRVLGIYKIPWFEDSVNVKCNRALRGELTTQRAALGSPLRTDSMTLECIEFLELSDSLP